jgi:hypothetical protein
MIIIYRDSLAACGKEMKGTYLCSEDHFQNGCSSVLLRNAKVMAEMMHQ